MTRQPPGHPRRERPVAGYSLTTDCGVRRLMRSATAVERSMGRGTGQEPDTWHRSETPSPTLSWRVQAAEFPAIPGAGVGHQPRKSRREWKGIKSEKLGGTPDPFGPWYRSSLRNTSNCSGQAGPEFFDPSQRGIGELAYVPRGSSLVKQAEIVHFLQAAVQSAQGTGCAGSLALGGFRYGDETSGSLAGAFQRHQLLVAFFGAHQQRQHTSRSYGCAVVGSPTALVQAVIADGRNVLLVDFFRSAALAAAEGELVNHQGHSAAQSSKYTHPPQDIRL